MQVLRFLTRSGYTPIKSRSHEPGQTTQTEQSKCGWFGDGTDFKLGTHVSQTGAERHCLKVNSAGTELIDYPRSRLLHQPERSVRRVKGQTVPLPKPGVKGGQELSIQSVILNQPISIIRYPKTRIVRVVRDGKRPSSWLRYSERKQLAGRPPSSSRTRV